MNGHQFTAFASALYVFWQYRTDQRNSKAVKEYLVDVCDIPNGQSRTLAKMVLETLSNGSHHSDTYLFYLPVPEYMIRTHGEPIPEFLPDTYTLDECLNKRTYYSSFGEAVFHAI